ncbi:MAG TPA: hypothetical protein VK638_58400, partial [Edaphobacter sp.]|nr:hypothetical protein [Edaphobacter sp.]
GPLENHLLKKGSAGGTPLFRRQSTCLADNRDIAVVVAVVAIGVMQVPGYQIVDVVTVGNGHVSAICPMLMGGIMAFALMTVCAVRRVGGIHRKRVLIHMTFVQRVEVSVVEIVSVIVVLDRCMPAILAVLMGMVFVNFVLSSHGYFSFEVC